MVGDLVDVKDSVGKWETAMVIGETDSQLHFHFTECASLAHVLSLL